MTTSISRVAISERQMSPVLSVVSDAGLDVYDGCSGPSPALSGLRLSPECASPDINAELTDSTTEVELTDSTTEVEPTKRLDPDEEQRLAQLIEIGLYAEHLLEARDSRSCIEDGRLTGNVADWGSTDLASVDELEQMVEEGRHAYRTMFSANIGLVVSLARQASLRRDDLDELIQEGCIGLGEAIRRYDYTYPSRFATFAAFTINRYIVDHIVASSGMTIYRGRLKRRLLWLKSAIQVEKGSPATISELADASGMPVTVVRNTLGSGVYPVDKPELDLMVSDRNHYESAEGRILAADVVEALNQLPRATGDLVKARFGIGREPCTWQVLAKQIGASVSATRRKVNGALTQLRELIDVGPVGDDSLVSVAG